MRMKNKFICYNCGREKKTRKEFSRQKYDVCEKCNEIKGTDVVKALTIFECLIGLEAKGKQIPIQKVMDDAHDGPYTITRREVEKILNILFKLGIYFRPKKGYVQRV